MTALATLLYRAWRDELRDIAPADVRERIDRDIRDAMMRNRQTPPSMPIRKTKTADVKHVPCSRKRKKDGRFA